MRGIVIRVVRGALISVGVMAGGLHSMGGLSFGHENHPTQMPDPQQTVAFRTYLMENIGANAKEMKGKIDAGQLAEAKMNAAAIALHSTRIAALFPEGSSGGFLSGQGRNLAELGRFSRLRHRTGYGSERADRGGGRKQCPLRQRTYAKDVRNV